MDSSEYIKKRIQSLRQDSEEIRSQSPITNDFDSWSVLKLILHSAAVNMYTTVLQNNDFFNDLYYIDALAGSGVSTYADGDACFLGSPIIAAMVAEEPFTKMYLIESDEEKATALEERMEFVFSEYSNVKEPDDWTVEPTDANVFLPEVAQEIKRDSEGGYNYYCFIDNQETNVKWDAIDHLIPVPWGDLLINIPTASAIGRNATTSPVPNDLNEFYCCDLNDQDIPPGNVRPTMLRLYEDCLSENGRPVQRSVNVDADVGSYEYDLVYATRDIEDGNGYIEVIDYVKKFIEDVDGGDVDNILQVLYDDQSSYEQFLPEDDVDDEIPEESGEDNQSKLMDFD